MITAENGVIIVMPGARAAFSEMLISKTSEKDTTVDKKFYMIQQGGFGSSVVVFSWMMKWINWRMGAGGALTSFRKNVVVEPGLQII